MSTTRPNHPITPPPSPQTATNPTATTITTKKTPKKASLLSRFLLFAKLGPPVPQRRRNRPTASDAERKLAAKYRMSLDDYREWRLSLSTSASSSRPRSGADEEEEQERDEVFMSEAHGEEDEERLRRDVDDDDDEEGRRRRSEELERDMEAVPRVQQRGESSRDGSVGRYGEMERELKGEGVRSSSSSSSAASASPSTPRDAMVSPNTAPATRTARTDSVLHPQQPKQQHHGQHLIRQPTPPPTDRRSSSSSGNRDSGRDDDRDETRTRPSTDLLLTSNKQATARKDNDNRGNAKRGRGRLVKALFLRRRGNSDKDEGVLRGRGKARERVFSR